MSTERVWLSALAQAPCDPVQEETQPQVELLVRPGQRLSDNDDDSASHRLAVVAMSGPDRATLLSDWEEAQRLLPFDIREVERADRTSTAR
jgi:hypothetical protein